MRATTIISACAIVVMGCAKKDAAPAADTGAMAAPAMAPAPAPTASVTAAVKDGAGHDMGSLTLADGTGGITVSGTLHGLTPGDHGIHLHTVGMCDGPAFTTAGGHFNPTSKMHGSQNPAGPHVGDMMNIKAGADSTATVQLTTTGGSLHAADMLMDADGAAIVVHAKADDYATDPSGASGDRVACGVVKGS